MTEQELKKLFESMSLSEKVGQLVQWNMAALADTQAAVTGLDAGNSVSGEYGSVLNFENAGEMISLQKKYLENHRIPLLFMMDVIHGYRTLYPTPLTLSRSFDPELARECASMAAREAVSGGVHVTFAPMMDHGRDARWGRIMEGSGEDPWLAGLMGAAQLKGFQGSGLDQPGTVAGCVKHFAAYGGAEAGREYYQAEISEHTLREWYLPAYKACLDAGARMLMPSFNVLNGLPSTVNPFLMKKVLKDEWKFDGMVISDYCAIPELMNHGVAADEKQAVCMAMDCGCDMDMVGGCYASVLEQLVREGRISQEQVDQAAMRVLRLKNDLGLFEDPYRGAGTEAEKVSCLTPENRALVKKAALASAVLLKNEGVLPFSENVRTVAVIGPFARTGSILGGWGCHGDPKDAVTVEAGVRALLPGAEILCAEGCSALIGDTDESAIPAAVQLAARAEQVILCLGEPQEYTGESCSRTDLRLPGPQLQLARAVLAANPSTAVLLFTGRPLDLSGLSAEAPAILDMGMPGTEGGAAAAELLYGRKDPCGKLTMSYPRASGQEPLLYARTNTGRPKHSPNGPYEQYMSGYLDCGNYALYPFGWGLSYTRFEYKALEPEKTEIAAGESLKVSVTLRNAGSRAGEETVQLYVHDVLASVAMPVQKLAAFGKVFLQPGQETALTLEIPAERLMLWNFNNRHVLEPGEFEVSAGCADHLLLTRTFTVK